MTTSVNINTRASMAVKTLDSIAFISSPFKCYLIIMQGVSISQYINASIIGLTR